MESPGVWEMALRLAAAMAAGMIVGYDRERREKAAGLRTLTLVSTGSALFVLATMTLLPDEVGRMSAGIATGVGFLGAGAIMREHGEVTGLTTAATVWIVAALGIAAASGAYTLTALGTVLALFILSALALIDFSRMQQDARTYEVTYAGREWDQAKASQCLVDAGLRVALLGIAWSPESVQAQWRVVGRRNLHEAGIEALRRSEGVSSFSVHE